MIDIEIPIKKWRSSKSRYRSAVSREINRSPIAFPFNEQFEFGGLYYHPYWIGKVHTSQDRLIFGSKSLYFYVVCNACNGTYLVLRGVPKSKLIKTEDDKVISYVVSKDKFEDEIVKEGINFHINRQFVFGIPESRLENSWLIYIPVQLVRVRRENGRGVLTDYFVNVFTGNIERQTVFAGSGCAES